MPLKDYYITGNDSSIALHGTAWYGQSFTAGSSYTVARVAFLMYRSGTPGNVPVNLYATDGASKPTGAALATVTFDADTLTTNSDGEWKELTFDAPYSVVSGTKYAIIPEPTAGNLYLHRDVTSPTYTGGNVLYTGDGGSSWTLLTTQDMMFKTYTAGTGANAEGTKTVTAAATVELASENYVNRQGPVPPRPTGPDPSECWDEDTQTWSAANCVTNVRHPGHWIQNVLTISEEGEIYFRTI